MNLTPENILSHAPDPGTAQRAKKTAQTWMWHSLEGNGRAVWGSHGPHHEPWLTVVDFEGPGFKCNCPVRRKPCKHGIGLLLLFAKQNDAFRLVHETPDEVAAWLEMRDARRGKKDGKPIERSEEEQAALDEKRKAIREKRHFAMEAGLAELESWLTDLLRQGLATIEGQSFDYWQELSGRMVDAKLPGIARRMRQFPFIMEEENWHEKLLTEIGDIYLIVKGFRNREHLPEGLQDDLLNVAGVNFRKAEVLAGETLTDHWLVAGQTFTEEENLMARRTWFVGEKSKMNALLLDFSWGGAEYETSWKMGTVVEGEVAFYPSAFPQRILFKNFQLANRPFDLSSGFSSFEKMAENYAQALSANPWLGHFPAFLQEVTPVFFEKKFYLVDAEKNQLPLLADETEGWRLVALSGGRPTSFFGIWDGQKFHP
jgi:hypothetical protein